MNGIFRLISWYLETTHNVPQNMFDSKIQNFRKYFWVPEICLSQDIL